MKFIAHLLLAASVFLCIHSAVAEPNLVFSRVSYIATENGEVTVPNGRAWKISSLPLVLSCPVTSSCPALYIDGPFKVGDKGKLINDHTEITQGQLNNKPLWIFAGAKVKLGIPDKKVFIDEYVASLDDDASSPSSAQAELAKPAIPILFTYRKALLSDGLVATFTNQSDRLLAILVTVRNPSFGRQDSFRLDIPPNRSKEIGHLEGWNFVSGDVITITHAEYAPLIKIIP